MKKFLIILLSLVLIATLGCAVACKSHDKSHEWATEWSSSSKNHWHACTQEGCDVVTDKARHKDKDKDGLCDVCERALEYTVTFRENNSRMLGEAGTVNGKVVITKEIKKNGYELEGWYLDITQNDKGLWVYSNKVDLATYVFTDDTDLYAKWNRIPTKGEEEGYCILGKITGLTETWGNGGFDPATAIATEEATLTYMGDKGGDINLYTITLSVKAHNSFKIKTRVVSWDDGLINQLSTLIDAEGGGVILGDGVTLPEGVKDNDPYNLFTYTYAADNNVSPVYDMNITINFYYAGSSSYAQIIVNEIGEKGLDANELGFIIVGSMTDWVEEIDATDTELSKYLFT
ncbi:MAG: InlB B-repeat-containing protein, partial [Clostridia bacterium]|nr:InlB B-repeat-containing protein [Clostridia bacterium]